MYAIILAAGKGSRMQSELPKPLIPLAGKPMLTHVVEAVTPITGSLSNNCLVYGYGGEVMKAHYEGQDFLWAHQAEQLGTGHAVKVACDVVLDDQPVIILYGDVPLITTATLEKLRDEFIESRSTITLLTAKLDDPSGYGRIIKNDNGEVTGIVEQKDASIEQLRIEEVNTGIMIAEGGCLRRWVNTLSCDNAQKEYYLTDVVEMASKEGYKVTSVVVDDPNETLGANDPIQLADLEAIYHRSK